MHLLLIRMIKYLPRWTHFKLLKFAASHLQVTLPFWSQHLTLWEVISRCPKGHGVRSREKWLKSSFFSRHYILKIKPTSTLKQNICCADWRCMAGGRIAAQHACSNSLECLYWFCLKGRSLGVQTSENPSACGDYMLSLTHSVVITCSAWHTVWWLHGRLQPY